MLSTLSTALVIGYGGYLVAAGSLTMGLLASFPDLRPAVLPARADGGLGLHADAVGPCRRRAHLLDPGRGARACRSARASPSSRGRAGSIDFESVSFAYELSRPVLQEVSFSVEPGQTVALVGRTGAGKTTVASLIPRFYDATGGAVRIDGQDVRQVTRAKPAATHGDGAAGAVPLLGHRGRQHRLRSRRSGSRRRSRLPPAWSTPTTSSPPCPRATTPCSGESGLSLSQGQRQLLAFARAIAADPKILILDEATANIDSRTEELDPAGARQAPRRAAPAWSSPTG